MKTPLPNTADSVKTAANASRTTAWPLPPRGRMGGNVWQWCEDEDAPGTGIRVVREAGWWTNPDCLLSSFRDTRAPELHDKKYGFRVVLVDSFSR